MNKLTIYLFLAIFLLSSFSVFADIKYNDFTTDMPSYALLTNTTNYAQYKGIGINTTTIVAFNMQRNDTVGVSPELYNLSLKGDTKDCKWNATGGYYGDGGWTCDSNDYMSIQYKASNDLIRLSDDDDFTLVMRFKGDPSINTNTRLLDHYNIAGVLGYILRLNAWKCEMLLSGSTETSSIRHGSANDTNNQYHECSFTYTGKGNNTMVLYVDGAEASSTTHSAAFATTKNITVGAREDFTQNFIGTYDKIAIYDYAMTKAEIVAQNFTKTNNLWKTGGSFSQPFNNSNNRTIWKNLTVDCAMFTSVGYNGTSCGGNFIVNVSYGNTFPTTTTSEIATYAGTVGNKSTFLLSGLNHYYFANVTISNLTTGTEQLKLVQNISVEYDASNDLYVSLTGSDSNSGTFYEPYRTISHCINQSGNYQTCHIGTGDFFEQPISAEALSILKPMFIYGNGTANTRIHLNESSLAYGFYIYYDNVQIQNLTIDGDARRYNSADFLDYGIVFRQNFNNSLIKDVRIENCTSGAMWIRSDSGNVGKNISVVNGWFWNNSGNDIYLDQGGQLFLTIENNTFYTAKTNGAISITSPNAPSANNLFSSGLIIKNNTWYTNNYSSSNYAIAINIDSDYTKGFKNAIIENNNFGTTSNKFQGRALVLAQFQNLSISQNNFNIYNSFHRSVITTTQGLNNSITDNNFCTTGTACYNNGNQIYILADSNIDFNASYNRGIFGYSADIFRAYTTVTNSSNNYFNYNNITITNTTNLNYVIGLGKDASSSIELSNSNIIGNIITVTDTTIGTDKQIGVNNCWNCEASHNTIYKGSFGLSTWGAHSAIFKYNMLINQTINNIYEKWGNYTLMQYNTIISSIPNIITVSIGGTTTATTSLNFTQNTINISQTVNTTTTFFQNSSSNNLYSDYNVWHFPYFEFNMSFLNGTTYYNSTGWNITNVQDLFSWFYPERYIPPTQTWLDNVIIYNNNFGLNDTVFSNATLMINNSLRGDIYWTWYRNSINIYNYSVLNITSGTVGSSNVSYNWSYGDEVTCIVYGISNSEYSLNYSCGTITAVKDLDTSVYTSSDETTITFWGISSFICVLGLILILMYKVKNIFGERDDKIGMTTTLTATAILLFVMYLIIYFTYYKVLLLTILLNFNSFILLLIIALYICELFIFNRVLWK